MKEATEMAHQRLKVLLDQEMKHKDRLLNRKMQRADERLDREMERDKEQHESFDRERDW